MRSTKLLESISALQRAFIGYADTRAVFDGLLSTFLDVTESEYGFIGEVFHDDGVPFLKTHAITDISWTDELRVWFEQEAPSGLEFRNLDTLFGAAITSGEVVMTNRPSSDARAGGIPDGHPPLRAFLGMPLLGSNGMVGLVGLANRPGGFDDGLVAELEPLVTTTAVLVEAMRNDRAEAEAQQALRRAAAILDNTPDFVGWADIEGKILYINRGGRAMVGLDDHADLGSRSVGSLAPDWAAKLIREEAIPTAVEQGVWTGEAAYLDGDGKEVPVSQVVIAHRGEAGELRYVSTIARDITERLELDRMKDEFISMISHELRTPLTSIVGYAEVLADGSAGELSDRQLDVIDTIGRNADRLLALIGDLLELGALGVREAPPQCYVDLAQLLEEQIETLRPVAAQAGVQMTMATGDEAAVMGQADQLERVIANLLSNAVKFTQAGGTAHATVTRSDDVVCLVVVDSGIGIPAQDQARLFGRFQRASNAQRNAIQGTGLGLSISREIVEDHRGSIELSSEIGVGTTVTVRLPAASHGTDEDPT